MCATFHVRLVKIWNASRICVSSLRRGHANLLCIVPILAYVLPKRAQFLTFSWSKLYIIFLLIFYSAFVYQKSSVGSQYRPN